MAPKRYNIDVGLSDYAISAYISLLKHHPVNGSQLSRYSGIPRARIYDVLRTLQDKSFVTETSAGVFIPLPPDEFIKLLRNNHEVNLAKLENLIKDIETPDDHDFIWTIKGYQSVLKKAEEVITGARSEIYVRLYPQEAQTLLPTLKQAEKDGVPVKCIFMEPFPKTFRVQVEHPQHKEVEQKLGGRSFDLIVDKKEFLGGMFIAGKEDQCRISWGRNRWFVIAGRDSLRHDFFHYFLYKTSTLKQELNTSEKRLYKQILDDM